MTKVYAIDGVIPVVHPTAYVHPSAALIGDVVVGPDCYVAPGASMRGDFGRIVLERGANFQDNCTAHCFAGYEVVIGEYASIGHGAVLHGCRVGRDALIGMNATVLDGAEIGEGALVSALSMVPSSFKAPPRTLIAGVPGKIIRELKERESAWMVESNRDYLGLAVRCHASLECVNALTECDDGPRLEVEGSRPLHVTRGDGETAAKKTP